MDATIQIIITDMGNGGAFCSNCHEDLDHGDSRNKIPPICPKCGATFVSIEEPWISRGSDF